MCCALSNLNLFWRLWNDPYNLVVVLCIFVRWYFSQVLFYLSSKIVLTLELRSRWKLTEKESPACRVGILCSAYHSSSYTDRSSRLPVYHFINRLACLFFYDFSTVGLEPKWPIRVYILWKNHDKKKTRTQHAQWHTMFQKKRLDWYYEGFDTIKIPQHKYTYIHTFVKER